MKLNFFNFKKMGNDILMTNDLGYYMFVTQKEFEDIVNKRIDLNSELGEKLLETRMIYDGDRYSFTSEVRHELRGVKKFVNTPTALHIFVVTTACNMACVYCQANNGSCNSNLYMTKETAEKAVDIALDSPGKYLTFEFQGGEPLLNFEVVKHIVEYANENKGNHVVQYNIVTNLTLLTDEIATFFADNKVSVSTSIDGNSELHNKNRPFVGGNPTYDKVIESVNKLRNHRLIVGAIQTTTKESLKYPREIVREYFNLGFDSIFLRPLTPLGKATANWDKIGYAAEEFLDFYNEAIDEIFKINEEGCFFKEAHAGIMLGRIMGNPINYMELRSPCGAGIGQIAYYADGRIFTCDEGRMLYEMGDDTFCLGDVDSSSYSDLICSAVCRATCSASVLETIPTCCDCVYQPYCGTCPVVNYASCGDIIEKQPNNYRCKVYKGILDHIFKELCEENESTIQIMESWVN